MSVEVVDRRPLVIVEETSPDLEVDQRHPSVALTERSPDVVISTPGPQGPAGAGVAAFVHDQVAAAAVWTINHNRGAEPMVALIDSASRVFLAQVDHPSPNQTVVSLNTPRAGRARLI